MPRRLPRPFNSLIELSQITPDIRRKVLRYATRRVRMIADAGCPVANDEPDILVADAITDTLTGVVVWDRRYHLELHLCSVVRKRTWNQIVCARRRRRVSLDIDGDPEDQLAAEHTASRRAPPLTDSLLATARISHELYQLMYRRAGCDVTLLALLDAYALGFIKPREVMRLTGMTRAEFLNARRRLDRAILRVPLSLCRAAYDVLRDSSE